MKNARIKIGFYVELADFRPDQLDQAQQLIERLQALDGDGKPPRVIPDFDAAVAAARALPPSANGPERDLEKMEGSIDAVMAAQGDTKKAAKLLGISVHTLRSRLQRYRKRGHIVQVDKGWVRL